MPLSVQLLPLMLIVSAIETVGDISGIAKGGANREATDKELAPAGIKLPMELE